VVLVTNEIPVGSCCVKRYMQFSILKRSSPEMPNWVQLKLTVLQYHSTIESSSFSSCQDYGTINICYGAHPIPVGVPRSYGDLVQTNSARLCAAVAL